MSLKRIGMFDIDSVRFSVKEKEFETGYIYSIFDDKDTELGVRLSVSKDMMNRIPRERIVDGNFMGDIIKFVLDKIKE